MSIPTGASVPIPPRVVVPKEHLPPGIVRSLLVAPAQAGLILAFYYLLPLDGDDWRFGALIGAAALVGLIPVSVRRTRRIIRSPRPLIATVEALVMLFVLLLVGFAIAHYATAIHAPSQYSGLHTKTDSLYFTVTTFTTVGFGDIVAEGQGARAFTTFQMVFDLAFLGIIVRAVTWAGKRGLELSRPGVVP